VGPFEAYDRIVALGAQPAHAEHVSAMRRAWQARTGAYAPEDPWFEARSRAFWDDALTTQGFARDVAGAFDESARPWIDAMGRAHRGLFRVAGGSDDGRGEAEGAGDGGVVVEDVVGGAAFVIDTADPGSNDALHAAAGLFDARLLAAGDPPRVAMLPGALFHPEDATDAILEVLASPRAHELAADELLDALLRMERSLRSLARVKAGYAYRESALSKIPHP
jgi:hypothetical protein